ncbi:hypothetical protein HDU96_009871 [Phlyctochytrium bullatum]|nr:hypothetical protein HDU96_009871 [Phlyctochytrium bullatum]
MDPETVAKVAKFTALGSLGLYSGSALYVSAIAHPAKLKDIGDGVRFFQKCIVPSSNMHNGLALAAAAAGATAAAYTNEQFWYVPTLFGAGVWAWTVSLVLPVNNKLQGINVPGVPSAIVEGDRRGENVDRAALRIVDADKLLNDWGTLHWVRTLGGVGAFLYVAYKVVAGAR